MRDTAVLLVAQQLATTRSGVGLYVRVLLTELARRGCTPAFATWTEEIDRGAFPDVEFVDLGARPAWDPTPGGFVALGRRLADCLGDADPRRYALLHFADAREAYGYVQKTRVGARIPFVGTVHDDYAAVAPASPLGLVGRAADPIVRWAYYRWLAGIEARTYRAAARLMANSDATGRVVARRYGLDAGDLRTVHLCVAPAAPLATDGASAIPMAGNPKLLFAGGNFYRKGLDTVVRALPAVRDTASDVRLFVAGHDRAERRIRRLAARLGVSDRLTFLGRVDRGAMAAAFAAADVFVMPSRTEALGLVYLEAMRAGVPVVSGNVGGVIEIVRDGESGLTVPPEDADALAAAILRAHGDPDLRRRLADGGRAVLAERTPERLADETLAVYADALSG